MTMQPSIPGRGPLLALAIITSLTACQTQGAQTFIAGQAPGGTPAADGAIAATVAAPTPLPTRVIAPVTVVTTDGVLQLSRPLVTVSFQASSRVTTVNVTAGQRVAKGALLAELNGADLADTLSKAQEQLALKQDDIANSSIGASQDSIKSSEAALNSAYAAYTTLKQGPSASAIEQALRSLNQSKNSLAQSQITRDVTCHIVPGHVDPRADSNKFFDPDCRANDLNVQASELRLQTAQQAYLDAQKGASAADLARARASITQSQASLAALKKGVSAEQQAVYALQLKQLQITIDRAKRDLDSATLLSPCDCVVQAVTLAAGASAGQAGVTLLDPTQLQFRTTNLTERDVISIKAGQAVSMRLKAFDQPASGVVEAILPLSSGTQGTAALYTVVIALDKADPALLPGMTGQADIKLK